MKNKLLIVLVALGLFIWISDFKVVDPPQMVEQAAVVSYPVPGCVGTCVVDDDDDGYAEDEGDCDDDYGLTFPQAFEICDGEDNDCNGQIDERPLATVNDLESVDDNGWTSLYMVTCADRLTMADVAMFYEIPAEDIATRNAVASLLLAICANADDGFLDRATRRQVQRTLNGDEALALCPFEALPSWEVLGLQYSPSFPRPIVFEVSPVRVTTVP